MNTKENEGSKIFLFPETLLRKASFNPYMLAAVIIRYTKLRFVNFIGHSFLTFNFASIFFNSSNCAA